MCRVVHGQKTERNSPVPDTDHIDNRGYHKVIPPILGVYTYAGYCSVPMALIFDNYNFIHARHIAITIIAAPRQTCHTNRAGCVVLYDVHVTDKSGWRSYH